VYYYFSSNYFNLNKISTDIFLNNSAYFYYSTKSIGFIKKRAGNHSFLNLIDVCLYALLNK